MIQHVVILGLMGSGKTSIGRRLADELSWAFDDSDETIEREQGETVRQLADELGVEAMHELEARHLERALSSAGQSVISAAASTIDNAACRAQMRAPAVFVVWLDVDLDSLVKRFAKQEHRPVFGHDPREMLAEQLATRGPHYLEVADFRAREQGRRPPQTVEDILAALTERGLTPA